MLFTKIGLIILATSFVGSVAGKSPAQMFRDEYQFDEAFNKENFLNPDNYNITKETIVTPNDQGLGFTGTVAYKMPFTFEQNTDHKIKLKFNIDNIDETGEIWVAFHSNPADVVGEPVSGLPGLYFRIKNNHFTSYTIDGYYTDGINYNYEMMAGTVTYRENILKDHTIQFETSMISGYTDGIRLFYNGTHFGDWLGYSMIKNRVLTDDNNKIYFSMQGNMTITNIVPSDITAPKITYITPEQEIGYANEEYVLGDVIIEDEIDGAIPYTYKLLNDQGKNISDKLYTNADGKLCFKPLEKGEYTFRVSSTDYSYNTASKRFYITVQNRPHYPTFVTQPSFKLEARRSEKYYFPVAEAKDITEDGSENDNNMEYIYAGYFYADDNKRYDLNVLQDDAGYYFNPSDYEAIKNDGVGQYFLTIEAKNSYGSSFVEKEIWVKYDVNGKDAYLSSNLFKKGNWALSSLINIGEDNVGIAGATYYKAGLALENGIKITYSIDQLADKTEADCWFSIALLKHPGHGKYGDNNTGLYFMFFYQNNAFRYNLQYVFDDGTHLDIKNNEVLYSEIPDEITLEVCPFDVSLDASMYDNITANFDGNMVDSFEIYKVLRSEFEDDEGFVYLACGYYNAQENQGKYDTTTNPKYKITKIINTDKTAPNIKLLGEIPTSAKANTEILLPNAIGEDETDGEIEATLLSVVNPKGRAITVINNVFTPTLNGDYTITYVATDLSGNSAALTKTITIEGGEDPNPTKTGGCGGSIATTSAIIAILAFGLLLFIKKEELN